MKLFLDTADLEEIEDTLKKGVISGITTNPSLIAKVPQKDVKKPFIDRYVEHIQKIVALCKKYDSNVPLSVEVFTENPKEMVEQARDLIKRINYDNLVIKIPAGWEELEAVKELSEQGINVNYTCCFNESQLELGALAGAKYISLFYNRLLDIGGYPLKVIENVRNFLNKSNSKAEIISGSIRHFRDITDCWNAGSHIVTAGYKHIKKMNEHLKTEESVRDFLNDLEKWKNA